MEISVRAIGGYAVVGKNMTAVKAGEDVIILDCGLNLETYIKHTEDEDITKISVAQLLNVNAIPDISLLGDWRKKVCAIVLTHAHLDHIGAIPFLAKKFKDVPIFCTPYTAGVLRTILRDEKISIQNIIKTLNPNSTYPLETGLKLEFIGVTHSTPQTVMAAIHTPKGVVIYANDFKFDNTPILGKKPNRERLKKLGKQGVLALIVDSVRSNEAMKTPSELVARDMLKDVLLDTDSSGKAVIVTTFASHLARLKSIIDFGKQMNRKIILLGRSLTKYVIAGEATELVNFRKDAELIRYNKKIKKALHEVAKSRARYLLVVTGHQGEPKSVLSRMLGEFEFPFHKEDHIIFSCQIIPNQTNIDNRANLEEKLKQRKVRIFKDIHVSGHAAREDHRDLINETKPHHIIPSHAPKVRKECLLDLAREMGYSDNQLHNIDEGETIVLKSE